MPDEVEILPPDKSLLAKIGVQNLSAVFDARAEAKAQQVIGSASDGFREEMLVEFAELQAAVRGMSLQAGAPLARVIELAFSIKAKAGLAEYKLVSEIAKSLYLYWKGLACPCLPRRAT